MPQYKVTKDTVGQHKQLYYKIHFCDSEFFRINSLDRISACLTGSGILYLLQRHTSQAAVSRLILCPTETYTGLVDAADVLTACNAHHNNGTLHSTGTAVTRKLASSASQHYTLHCTAQVLQWPGNLPAQLLNTTHIAVGTVLSLLPSVWNRWASLYLLQKHLLFRNTMYAFY